MKIRNDSENFAASFQSVLNWNDIQIGIERATKPNHDTDKDLNGELRDRISQKHLHNVEDIREKHSKYCIVLNKTTIKISQKHEERQPSLPTTLITYLLYKLMQLCLVIFLLLPFLITYNTLILQASCQHVVDPISMSVFNYNSDLYVNKLRVRHSYPHINQFQQGAEKYFSQLQVSTTGKECNTNQLSFQDQNNNSIIKDNKPNVNNKRNHFTNYMKVHSFTKSKNPIYSYNHRLNGYSLIILSQSANNLYSEETRNSSSTLKTEAPQLTTSKKSTLISIRTKRYIANNSQILGINKMHGADSQILEVAKKLKENPNVYMNAINKDNLAKLVMAGLGLKKLPDMKKANISQLEYSSKYVQYLKRLRKNNERMRIEDRVDIPGSSSTNLHIFSIETNKFSDITRKRWHHKRSARATESRQKKTARGNYEPSKSDKTNILLHFPLSVNDEFFYEKIDEANVRLMMLYNPALAAQTQRGLRLQEGAKMNRPKKNNNNNRHTDVPLRTKKKNCNGHDDYARTSSQHSYYRKTKIGTHIFKVKVYQLLPMNKRQQLDVRKIEFENSNNEGTNFETRSQWLEFDVTEAVRGWLNKTRENLGIEIQCDKCRHIGARILSDDFTPHHLIDQTDNHDRFHLTPVLNIIGHISRTHRVEKGPAFISANNESNSFSYHRLSHGQSNQIKKWPNSCYKSHQRCCRHQLNVAFKDVKGFEFIIQPKSFDAGFCKGRCPPRHNPAHHHALLQSLMWQQDHNRVPRPCCAPSKLTELEILHVDEEHSDKLKISTWSDMQVLECACS